MKSQAKVVVVGAGPYGLSAAAHLRAMGVEPHVIGQPMAFWKRSMPKKMLLRSRIEASNIAAPTPALSLDAYQKAIGRRLPEPLPIEDFIAYGDWFQRQVAPDLDLRTVVSVSHNGGLTVTMDDGERIHATHVVLALGIGPFLRRPPEFAAVPRELAPHTSDVNDVEQFRGLRVAVLGKGQSALEGAALLHEHGADVLIATRGEAVKYRPFAWRKHLFRLMTPGPLRPMSYRILPPTDLGDIKTARKMADPVAFRNQPPSVQQSLLNDCTKPVGAYWLRPRLEGVPIKTRVTVRDVATTCGRLKLTFSDGSSEVVDRVLLATGYKIDVGRYPLLDESLRQALKTTDGYPALSMSLETSVPGLYMAGVVGEKALGPTLRFVTGTSNAAPRLAAAISRTS